MANEIQLVATTGHTLYAVIRTTTGTVWNGAMTVTGATTTGFILLEGY